MWDFILTHQISLKVITDRLSSLVSRMSWCYSK